MNMRLKQVDNKGEKKVKYDMEIRHYYEVHGEGIPIIFIHPPCMGHVVFKYQKPLSKHYKIVFYDMRGHGKSEKTNEEVTITLLSNDLLSLIDEMGLAQVVLCGYSSGGSIAQEFSINYPDRVIATIICGGFPEVSSLLLTNEFRIGKLLAKTNKKLLAKILGVSHKVSNEDKLIIENYANLTDQKTLYDLYNNGMKYSCSERLKKLQKPIYLIYGSNDYYLHDYEKIYKQEVCRVKTTYIQGAFHQIPTKHAHAFNHTIHHYLQSLFDNNSSPI